MTDTTFAQLSGVPATVLQTIAARGYINPTPVQTAVLDEALRGKDLLVSSRTGSGKTLAFGLVLARELLGENLRLPSFSPAPLGLIVAPTRELAKQISDELTWLFQEAGIRVATCVGGVEMWRELRALKEGPHLVVGTPGRLVDHLERKSLKSESWRALVLDEADEMLDMGFREELERILRDAPAGRRTLLFSATIPPEIESLARSFQKEAARVTATPPKQAHQDIEVRLHLIAAREREHAVVNALRAADAQTAIVFCGTRDHVAHLHASLAERGFSAVALSGELTQNERTRALQALRDGRARVLVATDVAARGLDLPDVGIVIQADLAQNAEVWQHRSGRTGRAGRKGVSVMLVPGGSQRLAEAMLRKAGAKPVWVPVPGVAEIEKKDHEKLIREIEESSAAPAEEDLALARELLAKRTPEQLAAALVAARRASQPAPEELPLTQAVLETAKNRAKTRTATHPTREDAPPREGFARPGEPPPLRARPEGKPWQRAKAADKPWSRAEAAEKPWQRAKPEEPSWQQAKAAAGAKFSREGKAYGPGKSFAPVKPYGAPKGAEGKSFTSASNNQNGPSGKPLRDHKVFGDAVWFSVNVGRERNADPRWLLPLICRRGGVAKEQIGKIDIRAGETRFQIVAPAATSFEKSAKAPDKKDPGVFIKRLR